jgi:hypothetical protein
VALANLEVGGKKQKKKQNKINRNQSKWKGSKKTATKNGPTAFRSSKAVKGFPTQSRQSRSVDLFMSTFFVRPTFAPQRVGLCFRPFQTKCGGTPYLGWTA